MDYNFDRVANQYDATRAMPPEAIDRICRWVLSRLPKDPAIAEIGVGTGRIALPFIQNGVRYTGFDISTEMLDRLQQKLAGNLHNAQFYIADITEPLPVPGESQDAVIAVHILHLVDAVKALHQVRRILKPHGALVWGYQHHGDDSVRWRVRSKFYEIAQALGSPRQREFVPKAAQELLHELGAQVSRHTVATWTQQESPRQALSYVSGRLISATWHMPEEIMTEAVRQTEAWALAEFGDLDRIYPVEESFKVDWYQF